MSLTAAGTAPAANRGGKDIAFAVGIVLILCLFFLPVPAFMIDFGLALSIALAVLILMVALWIHKPLEFSAFPTVLLVATILRTRAQHLDHAPHPLARRAGADVGGLHHRRLRAPGDGRRFRHLRRPQAVANAFSQFVGHTLQDALNRSRVTG